ncbi:DUF47 family protein [bacterium]|nr:DUF47 family protein [bacterium]
MGIFSRFLPREAGFFDYFEKLGALSNEACKELLAMTTEGADIQAHAMRIRELEKQADRVHHHCADALHKTFITPFDRADIHLLANRIDDVIDSVDSTASRIVLYELAQMRPEAKELAEVLVRATSAMEKALHGLRDMKNAEEIKDHCVEIYKMENEGDTILRLALVRLFKEEEKPILVMKWKEIYERLEKATDRCESVASVIQGIVIEAS